MTKVYNIDPALFHHEDKGCEFSESCLNCPFPECIEDIKDGKRKFIKEQRDTEIIKLWKQGKTHKELASIFGLRIDTIRRAIARMNKGVSNA